MKILCLGHAAYDITLPVDSYPLENKKQRYSKKTVECGGGPAATAAYLLAYWGEDVSFAGVVGNDLYGKKIKEEFLKVGVKTDYLEISPTDKTTLSYIIANQENGTRTILTYKEKSLKFKKLNKIEEDFDYILVDGDEEELSKKVLLEKPKALSMLDAGRCNESTISLAKQVDYLVCSNDFARDYTKLPLDYNNQETIKAVYDKLQKDFKAKIIITLEKYGSFVKIADCYKLIPSLEVKALDSTGAGDIYHGALLYFLIHNYPLEKAMYLANVTSALSVLKIGGRYSIPPLEEVLKYAK